MECGLSSIPTTQNRDRPTDLRQTYDTRKLRQRQQPGPKINCFLKFVAGSIDLRVQFRPENQSAKTEALLLDYSTYQELYLLIRQAVQ
jgi:hypothetical protein